ncbi:hypothetical protein DN392_28800 [Bacillus sp. BB51/4]|uniref:hypothetical protein n=1 Tax=Bacillus cereus group TaxID=86661 RepID=UPI0011ED4578|nr:hypothetical protein [Bacillus sp. BB51/4]KAA0767998.1 hypothetical protein DN392_28800 [Bacillus sp. BB51/4]
MKYFYTKKLVNITSNKAQLGELKTLIRGSDLDVEIKEAFPLEEFGAYSEEIQVNGSSDLLLAFNKVDNEKMDLPEKLEDIEFCGFDDEDNNIILKFKGINNLESAGIYNFTYEFLDDLFALGRFYSFSEEKQTLDVLSNTLDTLFTRFSDVKRQYRFLNIEDEWRLRGITSTSYKNYDNHLVLYLTLLGLHDYAKKTGNCLTLSGGQISDSDVSIFFEDPKPVNIKGIGDVYFGIFVSNGEIRQKRFTFEVMYRIDNGEVSFSAMPELEEPLIKINHTLKVDSVKKKINNIFELDKHKEDMLTYIKDLRDIEKLSLDAIHLLFNKIIKSKQKFSEDTKKKAKKLREDKVIIKNTLTLIELLNRVSELTTDVNERVHLQRIYDNVIRTITKAD